MKNKNGKIEIISEKQNLAPFFRDENFGFFSGSLSDIAAVKAGVKPACRLVLSSLGQAVVLLAFCAENGFYWHIPKTKAGAKYVFISKSAKIIAGLKKIPPKFFYADSLGTPERKKISAALGYPPCCVRAHLADRGDVKKILETAPRKLSFLLNNFLNPVSNFYLSFHFPCSFSCEKTKKYNRRIFSVLSRQNPCFSESLEKILKMPVLVFGSPTSFNDFWNSRCVLIFDGKLTVENEIVYKNVFKIVPFEDNFLARGFLNDFNALFDALRKSDRVKASGSCFELRKGKKTTEKWKNSDRFIFKIFNFA